ncbi:MAG: MarR family transcriptional regulator [Dictyoglomi bacterium]|nr:MarR family transcriptional regulator [Dictyoglomota bacterium]HOL55080.1 MarR family transcriptional regulator [bacterium]HRU32500.1 MarR family transcriptional regulator [bacterium]
MSYIMMNEEIDILLNNVMALIKSRNRRLMESYGITPLQYRALSLIKDKNPTMGDLCNLLYLSSSSVTDLVDRIESNRLARRIRSSEDRRVITLEITEEGISLLEEIREKESEVLSKSLNLLDEETKIRIKYALEELYNVLKKED